MFRCSRSLAKDSSDQLSGLIQRANKAAGAWKEACQTLRPPSAAGREAFSQDVLRLILFMFMRMALEVA